MSEWFKGAAYGLAISALAISALAMCVVYTAVSLSVHLPVHEGLWAWITSQGA